MPPRSVIVKEGPWVPTMLTVRRPRRGQSTDRRTGANRTYWELRWFVDGTELRQRFERAGDATEFGRELQDGFRAGWAYDGAARRFVDPSRRPSDKELDRDDGPVEEDAAEAPTVFDWTGTYWAEKWSSLEPSSRSELSRYLNRARRHFVDREPSGGEAQAVEAYLRTASLAVREQPLTDAARIGLDWIMRHSLPLDLVGRDEIERFLSVSRVHSRYPDRQISPASERRMVADLKQCWARAVERDHLVSNPWDKVRLRTRSAGGSRVRAGKDALTADKDVVLTPEQVFELAEACVTEGSWGPIVRCFVLVMGLCGLRPSEAAGLIVGDIDVASSGPGWVTVRRTHRKVPTRYLEDDEDPEWGPLKGRDIADTRRAPVPAKLAELLREHLTTMCTAAAPHDLVFQRSGRPVDLAVFGEDVWKPARAKLFPLAPGLDPASPLQPKLARLRRHDLRHSACSLWLRAGVDVSVCQRWSGHKQLSVFLDIYQGLIPGREESGVVMVEEALSEPSSIKAAPGDTS